VIPEPLEAGTPARKREEGLEAAWRLEILHSHPQRNLALSPEAAQDILNGAWKPRD